MSRKWLSKGMERMRSEMMAKMKEVFIAGWKAYQFGIYEDDFSGDLEQGDQPEEAYQKFLQEKGLSPNSSE